MAKEDTPIFSVAKPGKLITSEDWNLIQRELRYALRHHKHAVAGTVDDTSATSDDAVQIGTDEIADNAVTAGKLSAAAVETDKITDQAVTAPKLADGAVVTDKLADKSVTAAKIADDVVTGIEDGAVTTPKIADNAVTAGKLASSAVVTQKLAPSAVTPDKLSSTVVATLTSQVLESLARPAKWISPALGDLWQTPPQDDNFKFAPVGYYKDSLGFVRLRGVARSSTAGLKGALLFQFPSGYRPSHDLLIPGRILPEPLLEVSEIMGMNFCVIRPSGEIFVFSQMPQTRAGVLLSVDNITFRAEELIRR
ncbi:hypothetical protein DENIS_2304 [Desulfonema ishimotonii]|uniref:Tail fiber protein n=1 Tax=Desulfonema ishimotonii TaxID=45657 RepID=A0A401FWN6_9BACT|nr:hypothetical protein [Desulfonema ishimotonii]GBC61344.1 hypothetical protein DENIS_2304 [Desulfonema ishimotonii]